MRLRIGYLLVLAGLLSRGLEAQDMEVPVPLHVSILLKVLAFDHQLKARAPMELVIGIAYQSGFRTSTLAKDEVVEAAAKASVGGLPVRMRLIDLDHEKLSEVIAEGKLTHLYITPLRAFDVRSIAVESRDAQISTITGVPRYLSDGLSLSVGLRGGRPRILVNLESSRREGADLSAEVLKLAELIK